MHYIYVHGLGQNSSAWDEVINSMKIGKPALCTNLPELIKGTEATYANLYTAFSEFCDNISEPLSLCGLSLGAVLTLDYAANNPHKVKALTLIGAQYKMPRYLLKFQNIILKFMKDSSFDRMGFGKKDFITLSDSMSLLDFSNVLEKIKCNTLIICGGKDKANKQASMELSTLLNHADLHIIEEAGHEVNIDSPKKLASILEKFYNTTCSDKS